MPTPSRKTPQRITRMLALHGQGASAREIAEELGLHHRTILLWLGNVGLEAKGGGGPRNARQRYKSPEGDIPLVDSAQRLNELSTPAPGDKMPPLEHARARLAQCSAMIEKLRPGILKGEANPSTLVQLCHLERDLRSEVAGLLPRDRPDPERDPANRAAAATVRKRLELLVEAAERAFRCAACGKSPY